MDFSKEFFNKNFKENAWFFLLIIILLFGFFIRVAYLDVPPFWVDESISAIASKSILEKGSPVFDSGHYYGRAMLFHYSQSLSMLVFGVNDFGARFVSVIIGLLTVILAFLFGREFFRESKNKNYLALIPALIFSLFYLQVFFSMQARFYQLFQLAFFATIYFLYKSRQNKNYSYLAVISFIIALDTQIAGIILAPFVLINLFISDYRIDFKKFNLLNGFFALITLLFSFNYLGSIFSFGIREASEVVVTSAPNYFDFFSNMWFVLILFFAGLIYSLLKKKEISFYLLIISSILFLSVVFVELFAFRYFYPVIFFILLLFSISFCFLVEKYGKGFYLVLFLVIILTSNFVFPLTYVFVLSPISAPFNDYSAPIIDFRGVSNELKEEMREGEVVSFFSATLSWYIVKPGYAILYSMDGRTPAPREIEVYSGAKIISEPPSRPYFYVKDFFSFSKERNKEKLSVFEEDCDKRFSNNSVEIFYCG